MITVNGQSMQFDEDIYLTLLMEQLGYANKPCAIEVNQKLVPHHKRESHVLSSGDTIEIVTLVGGG